MIAASWTLREGDVLDELRTMPDSSVQCVVTSPPYWGLRDYGVEGQIGLEPTLGQYLERLVDVFREVRRVLRHDGTCWVNMGDAYASPGGTRWTAGPAFGGSPQHERGTPRGSRPLPAGFKRKDLLGLPWRLALALQDDGWWLRAEVIWHKLAGLPESALDRPTRAHEQVFLLTKRPTYFYDAEAIREPDKGHDHARGVLDGQPSLDPSGGIMAPHNGLRTPTGRDGRGANKRSVWPLPPEPYGDAHFATFPPGLVEPCILAGTSDRGACTECGAPRRRVVAREVDETRPPARQTSSLPAVTTNGDGRNGRGSTPFGQRIRSRTLGWEATCAHRGSSRPCVVLDPLAGAGTTLMVAQRLGRSSIGIELNPEYAQLARRRIVADAPLLNSAAEVVA